MWRIIFWPVTKAFQLLKSGIAKGAGAAASAKAAQAGIGGTAKAALNKSAQAIASANVDKWAGRVLLGTLGSLGALGGYMGLSAVIKTDETAQKVGDWMGGTVDEAKNVALGLALLAGITAIAVGAYIVIKARK